MLSVNLRCLCSKIVRKWGAENRINVRMDEVKVFACVTDLGYLWSDRRDGHYRLLRKLEQALRRWAIFLFLSFSHTLVLSQVSSRRSFLACDGFPQTPAHTPLLASKHKMSKQAAAQDSEALIFMRCCENTYTSAKLRMSCFIYFRLIMIHSIINHLWNSRAVISINCFHLYPLIKMIFFSLN